jgi:hypothetical protein
MQIQNTYQNALQSLYNGGSSYQLPTSINQGLYQNNPMSLPFNQQTTDPMSLIASLVNQVVQLAQGMMSMFGKMLGMIAGNETSSCEKQGGGISDLIGALGEKLFGGKFGGDEGDNKSSAIFSGLFKAGAAYFGS